MATCLAHNFRNCSIKSATCASCCAQSAPCKLFYIDHLVGSANNLQVGDKIHQDSKCGVIADIGIYTDCGPDGSCDQPIEGDKIYGCVTVGSGGLVTAIAACSGEVTCGSGAGSTCESASTIETPTNVLWNARNKTKVAALDTWEDLYIQPEFFRPISGSQSYRVMEMKPFFIKQIWIHNCYAGKTNDKRFSVRVYNAGAVVRTLNSETGVVTATTYPAEAMLADHMLVADGARIALLDEGSPLALSSYTDKVQIQANTDITGWTVTLWIEQANQNWDYMSKVGMSVYNTN